MEINVNELIKIRQPHTNVGSEDFSYKEYKLRRDQEELETCMRYGWMEKAIKLLDELGDKNGWSKNYGDHGEKNVLNMWAAAGRSEADEVFLEKWADYEKRSGYKENVLKDSLNRYDNGNFSNSVRCAVSSGQWWKANELLKSGKEWGQAHCDVMERAFNERVKDDDRQLALEMLKMSNVKDWINKPISWHQSLLGKALMTESGSFLVDPLLKAGADINAKLQGGNTLLHLVMGNGGPDSYKALYKKLIKMGSNVDIMNDEGKTPYDSWKVRHDSNSWSVRGNPKKTAEWNALAQSMEREWLKLSVTKGTNKKMLKSSL